MSFDAHVRSAAAGHSGRPFTIYQDSSSATGARILENSDEPRDGMVIEWYVPIQMDDGLVLRADVFRPRSEAR